jgi:hypothetical protein
MRSRILHGQQGDPSTHRCARCRCAREFLNMPGLCLTEAQACRFSNVEPLV